MSYQDDKRELLKLKQGLIEESEIIHEEKKEKVELHGMAKVSNFFYHYKWHVIVAAFFILVAGFLIYDVVKKEAGDIRVLVITRDKEIANNVVYKTKDFELAFEKYCPDFDDNGYVHADVYNIDLSESSDTDYMNVNVTKAMGEISHGEAQLYIVDSLALESLTDGGSVNDFVNIEELYPDCPQANGVFYTLKDSDFAVLSKYVEACPDDLHIIVRRTTNLASNKDRAEKAQKRAMQVLDNIVNAKLDGWEDDDGRVYGIYDEGEIVLEPTL